MVGYVLLMGKKMKLFLDCSKKTGLNEALYYPISLCDSFKELEKYNAITKNKKGQREKIKIQKEFSKITNILEKKGTFTDVFSIVRTAQTNNYK